MKHEANKKDLLSQETQLLEDCVFLYGLEEEMKYSTPDRLPGELMGKHVGACGTPMDIVGLNEQDLYDFIMHTRNGVAVLRTKP